MVGNKFNKLTIIKDLGIVKNTTHVECICECGNNCVKRLTQVTNGIVKSCGCLSKKHFVNHIGKKNNLLTLVELIGQNHYKCWIYKAKCDCGKLIVTEGNDVLSGKIKSCGCLKIKRAKEKANPLESLPKAIYRDYKIKAKQRNLEFTLTFDEFKDLIFKPCYYCNAQSSNSKTINDYVILYNGIDRLDNTEGYNIKNCKPCCRTCNQAKHMLTLNAFKNWLASVLEAKEKRLGAWE